MCAQESIHEIQRLGALSELKPRAYSEHDGFGFERAARKAPLVFGELHEGGAGIPGGKYRPYAIERSDLCENIATARG
jgi:hypothetical protein